jgi:hypothetical protein
MSFKHGIMHVTLRENFGDRVTHGLTDAQLALRGTGLFSLLMMARHETASFKQSSCPRLSRASTSSRDIWL